MKVLMGVDDSEFSGDLVRAVVKQFRSETTEVLVLHVLQQVGPAVPEMDAGYAPEMEGEGKLAHALVDRIARDYGCGLQDRHRRRGGRYERRHHRCWHKVGRRLDRGWLAWAERYSAFLAWQRSRICSSPCELFRGNRPQAEEYLKVSCWLFAKEDAA